MKKLTSIVTAMSFTLLILFSCKEDNEHFEQIAFKNLTVKSITFNSVEISGIITENNSSNIIDGGYFLGKNESVDSVIYKETLNKSICDTLSLNPDQEYWIQSFVKTKTTDTIKGDKFKFRISDYKIIFEKYVTIAHEFENRSSPSNRYNFTDCIIDPDENIVLVGGVSDTPSHPYMVKIDKNGNYLWHNTFSNIPERWAYYSNVFISKENDYLAICFRPLKSLYVTKISSKGMFIANKEVVITEDTGVNPHWNYDIAYDKINDTFTLYCAIPKRYNEQRSEFFFKIIKFNSNGVVLENKHIESNYNMNQFGSKIYRVDDNSRYCIGHLPNFYDGSIVTKVDESMNVLYKKELFGYNIQQLSIRENNILVIAMTYSGIGTTRKFKFFEIDKNLTEFKELSEQWAVSEPFIYSCFKDKKENVIISGGNSYNMFNELGAMCIISNDNKFLYKEHNFGVNDLISGLGKWMITRFEFIKELSDNSILLIGKYNPDFYDGPIDKVYLRKISY